MNIHRTKSQLTDDQLKSELRFNPLKIPIRIELDNSALVQLR